MLEAMSLLEALYAAVPTAQIDDVPLRDSLRAVVENKSLSLGGLSLDAWLDRTSAAIRCASLHSRRLKKQPEKWKHVLFVAHAHAFGRFQFERESLA